MELSFIRDENAVESIDGMTYAFPYVMHERDLGCFTVPWHWHEELELDYAYRGSIQIETTENTYTVRQGEAYFINTNVMNTKRRSPGAACAVEHAHLFHPILLAGHYRSVFETKYLDPVLKDRSLEVLVIREDTKSGKELLRLLAALTRLRGRENAEFEIRTLLSQAWLALLQELDARRQTRRPLYQQERAKELLRFLHMHYADKLTVSELAAHAGVSEKECIRSFKAMFHQTPMDYLSRYRIGQAMRLLREGELPVTQIAFQCGFQSSAYFTKVFRQQQGVTPTQFRRQHTKTQP